MSVIDLSAAREYLEKLNRDELKALRAGFEKRLRESGLATYQPYRKQIEFHRLGTEYRERLLMAANQVGKTVAAGAEVAMHLTGRYPNWWKGRVFDRPVAGWAAGVTAEATRDNPQRILLGRPNAWGTGMIPKNAFAEQPTLNRSVADGVDTLIVRHGGGGDIQSGESILQFKNYNQGREKFQGETLDFGWCDEEPPEDVYIEFLTRLQAKEDAIMLMTFTPLQGMSLVVKRFMVDKKVGTIIVSMTLEDAEHYSEERRKEIEESYPEHLRDAKARGIPVLGSGAVFPIPEQQIAVQPFELPAHWPRLAGIDFGFDHPTAVSWLALDRDTDTTYLYATHGAKRQPVAVHASAIRAKGDWIPVAWPKDGNNETAAGPALAKQYRDEGINMLAEHATLPENPGGKAENTPTSRVSLEGSVGQMLASMIGGTFKVFSTCGPWIEEFRLYHRKDGIIVKEMDDYLDSSRYGWMMRRFAALAPSNQVAAIRGRTRASWRAA